MYALLLLLLAQIAFAILVLTYLSAYSYQNQKEVAAGIKRAYQDIPGLKREDLFIVSFANARHLRADEYPNLFYFT